MMPNGVRKRRSALFGLMILVVVWLPFLALRLNLFPNFGFAGSFQADLLALLSLGAVILSLLIGLAWVFGQWLGWRERQIRIREQNEQHAAYRRFLHRLDHEIKNPLAVMRVGFLNMQHSLNPGSEQWGTLARMDSELRRLQKLVEDLRYITELEERSFAKSVVDLEEVLEEAIALTSSDGRTVELNVQQVPWPLSPVWGDADLLLVAFRNLLDNALKYTRASGQVEVRAVEDAGMAVIEVADTGVGISSEDVPNVFEDLYRGHNVEGVQGSGLGLAMVQRIVTLHDGKIELQSRLDQGTVLKVRLPLAAIKNQLPST